jgi:hypothetical protein
MVSPDAVGPFIALQSSLSAGRKQLSLFLTAVRVIMVWGQGLEGHTAGCPNN